MEFRGKAFYNLLRINGLEDPNLTVEKWQVENLREWDEEALFERLSELGVNLDQERFILFSEDCDSPEELAQCLVDEEGKREEQVYLLVFELWRRLCRNKVTLSIFCDELDSQLMKYDLGQLEDNEGLIELLDELENLLDESVDEGGKDQEVLKMVQSFLAHDIETFLCDYILTLIESEQETAASELIDGFYKYIQDKRWFDFLRLHLLFETDQHEATLMAERIIEELQERPDFDLLVTMLEFFVHVSETDLFLHAFILACEQIQTEQDFCDLLDVAVDYFSVLDWNLEAQELTDLRLKRKKEPAAPFDPADPAFQVLGDIFIKKFQSV